jgi:hypothetical protein
MESAVTSSEATPVVKISHPASLLGKIMDRLGAEYVDTNLAKFGGATTAAFCYAALVIQAAKKSSNLRNVLVGVWKKHSGSGDFTTANKFAEAATQIDSSFDLLEPAEAFDIIVEVCKAAKWGAFGAIELRDYKFTSTPILAGRAMKYANEQATEADEKVKEVLSMSVVEFTEKYLQSPSGL